MTVSSVYGNTSPLIRQITSMRSQMDDLLNQLSTGKKSTTYGGLGTNRGLSIAFRAQSSQIAAYQDTVKTTTTRINVVSTTLDRLHGITQDMQGAININNTDPLSNGKTFDQQQALNSLDEVIGLLNGKVGGRYSFGGASVDVKPIPSLDMLLDGDITRGIAGLKQVTAERREADLGADGLGRLTLTTDPLRGLQLPPVTSTTVPAPSATVTLGQGASPSVNDFTLTGVSATTFNPADVTVSGAGTTPVSVQFNAQPSVGDTISIDVALPGGGTTTMTLTAVADPSPAAPGPGEFVIGATLDDTANNLRNTLSASIQTEAAALPDQTKVTLAPEQFAGMPFGFKLNAVSSTFGTAATVTPAAGVTPDANGISVDFKGVPTEGTALTMMLGLPDGTEAKVTLKAVNRPAGAPADWAPAVGQFEIGADAATTMQNFQRDLKATLIDTGKTELGAASGIQASREFFAADGNPPQRVDFTPPATAATATSLRNGTATDTVDWFQGDSTGDARDTSKARIDSNVTIDYGVRADERAFATLVANLAALAVGNYANGNDPQKVEHSAMASRVYANLAYNDPSEQSLEDIQTEVAGAYASVKQAGDRHLVSQNTIATAIDKIEGTDDNEIGVLLLSLQNRMTATYQATSILYKMSLVNFI